jgi:stage V sporulation protein SpoVS
MDWGKVIYIFFALMSLTTTVGFLYEHNEVALFVAASINLISTLLKIGVKNILAAELFASSLVADLHLIPAFIFLQIANNETMAISLAIGAIVANMFSLALVLIEALKTREEF